jgi:rubredoxin
MQRHPVDRALMLYAMAVPDAPREQLADAPLGARNAALMAMRIASFGRQLSSWLDCSACGERMEFDLDPSQLPPEPTGQHEAIAAEPVEVAGHRFHYPTSRHLARLARFSDPESAARQLLLDCAESAETLPGNESARDRLLADVEDAIEAGDPWADLSLQVHCPACGHEDQASFDIASYLWEEIDQTVQRLLDDIHTLAGAYGWPESTILGLSETRRAAYLARIDA